MTRITGYLYNALGQVITVGKLYVKLQQDIVSVDGTKVVPLTITTDLSENGGLIDLTIYETVGATPADVAYFVEFDPDPADTSKMPRSKDGYWSNYWVVPRVASIPLGNFVTASRKDPLVNFMPAGGATSTTDHVLLGPVPSSTTKGVRAAMVGKTPEIRYNPSTNAWEFSNDGVAFSAIGSGGFSGGDVNGANGTFTGSVTADSFTGLGSGLTNLNASFLGSGTIPDARFPSALPAISGANLTNLNAANLGSGLVPLARLSGITNAQIDAAASIAWSKLNKTGSSLADLATRSAADLTSGILAIARGGTGGSANPLANGVAYGTGSALAYTAAGSVGQILKVGVGGAPVWGDPAAASGHSLLSTVHSDVAAAAVTRGALIAGIGATPAWSSVAIGASGSFLRSNGVEPSWSVDGSGLTTLNASNIATGTLADARLSANVLKGSGANVFSALQTFDAGIRVKNAQTIAGRNAAGTADLSLLKLDADNQVALGSNSAPTVMRSNGNRPTGLLEIDHWLELSGSSPNKTISLMVYVDGAPRTLAQIKI